MMCVCGWVCVSVSIYSTNWRIDRVFVHTSARNQASQQAGEWVFVCDMKWKCVLVLQFALSFRPKTNIKTNEDGTIDVQSKDGIQFILSRQSAKHICINIYTRVSKHWVFLFGLFCCYFVHLIQCHCCCRFVRLSFSILRHFPLTFLLIFFDIFRLYSFLLVFLEEKKTVQPFDSENSCVHCMCIECIVKCRLSSFFSRSLPLPLHNYTLGCAYKRKHYYMFSI